MWRARFFSTMKTLLSMILAGAISIVVAQAQTEEKDKTAGEKTSEAWDKTKEATKDAGRAVADTTKKATKAVVDALTPDADARKVNVTLMEHRIDMPKSVEPGKTAFVVKNSGKEKHNFEVEGQGIEEKFFLALGPDETKVLHVNLKTGTYKVYCPMKDHEKKGMEVKLTVR